MEPFLGTKLNILTMRATNKVLNGSIVDALLLCGSPVTENNLSQNELEIMSQKDLGDNDIEKRRCCKCRSKQLTHSNLLFKFIRDLLRFFTSFSFPALIACLSSGRRRRVFRILSLNVVNQVQKQSLPYDMRARSKPMKQGVVSLSKLPPRAPIDKLSCLSSNSHFNSSQMSKETVTCGCLLQNYSKANRH